MHKNPTHRASVLQHVSLNVRRLRNAAGMSQSALAERSGVSRRMLVGIESGDANVSLNTLDRIDEQRRAVSDFFEQLSQTHDRLPDAGPQALGDPDPTDQETDSCMAH